MEDKEGIRGDISNASAWMDRRCLSNRPLQCNGLLAIPHEHRDYGGNDIDMKGFYPTQAVLQNISNVDSLPDHHGVG